MVVKMKHFKLLKSTTIIFITIVSILFAACKEKKIESVETEIGNESDSSSDVEELGYEAFPVDFPVDWLRSDSKIRFMLDSGLRVSKNYYLKPSRENGKTFAVGICHYSSGSDGNNGPSIILEPPKLDKIDFSQSNYDTPEELQTILDYMFPDGKNCVIEYKSDYTDQDRKGAYVYKDSVFFDSFYTQLNPDYSNPKENEPLEPMPLVEKGFSIDDIYRTDLYCTFHTIRLSDRKIIYRIEEDTGKEETTSEVGYQFTHIDGMPFIKMEKAFPKEFYAGYIYEGVDTNPDDKMLFLLCKTRDLGNQAIGITRADVPAFMMIEPRWLEMSGRTYKDETSHLVEKNGNEYPIQNLCSMDSETPWVEGVPGYGIGESFVIENTWGTVYKTLLIMNGFISYERPYLYKQNGRIKKIKVTGVKSGNEKILDVLDTPHPQSVDISFITEAEDLRVTIVEVYPGTKYEDTCIHFMINSLTEAVPYELSIK